MVKYLVYFVYFCFVFKFIYGSTYKCQNEIIKISCPFRDVINITDAFYGRDNSTICANGNMTEEECSFANATSIISNKCDHKESCTIFVNSTDLGDSCSGVSAYLEVNYTCVTRRRCGKNEHFERDVCKCLNLCPNQKECLPYCPMENGCVCDDGYLRDIYTSRCVLADHCPLTGKPEHNHEEFCECASRQRTCRNPFPFFFFHFGCEPGYACIEGFLREPYTNICVIEDECPRPYRRWK